MISVLIETRSGQEERLARTLASLVPAAVEGAVREVIVIDPEHAPGVGLVADHAGCRTAETLLAAIEAAKSEWLLLLEPGARLLDGWSESVLAHAAGAGRPARLSRDASVRRPLGERLWRRARPLSRGLLITRREAAALARGKGEGFAKRLRLHGLAARIVPAG